MQFNHTSRKKNIALSVLVNTICKGALLVTGFWYRTAFLRILSVEYLGINGLFSGILGLLSLADLGISVSIVYRIYQPVSRDDVQRVGQLMRFYKKAFQTIAISILVCGLIVLFFLPVFIKDISEVPKDINIYLVFFLYLVQIVSPYFFTYKLTLFDVDQKQYVITIINAVIAITRYLVQFMILAYYRNFTLALLCGTLVIILFDFLAGIWASKKYPNVFSVHTDISPKEKKDILKDTFASICHKIGGVIILSTDNILLSKFIGLAVIGIYSNYALILNRVSELVGVVFDPFSAAFGNVHVTEDSEDRYRIYRRSLLVNFWISGVVTVCFYTLLDDFIMLWLGKGMLLDSTTVFFLCFQFYISATRRVSGAYISSCGLFVKDKARTLIEALLNLLISIVLLKMIGVAGVFAGTVISCLMTSYWREPYLLFKHIFKRSSVDFWLLNFKNMIATVLSIAVAVKVSDLLFASSLSIFYWIIKGIFAVLIFGIVSSILFISDKDFRFSIKELWNKVKSIRKS